MHQLGLVIFPVAIVVIYIVYNRVTSKGIKSVNATVAQDLIKESNVLILDVRTPQEFQGGHIKGAKPLPVSEIEGRIGEVTGWKDKQILVYCRAGSRSTTACHILKKNGFTKLANLNGGF